MNQISGERYLLYCIHYFQPYRDGYRIDIQSILRSVFQSVVQSITLNLWRGMMNCLFCYAVLDVLSSFAIILMRKRGLMAFLMVQHVIMCFSIIQIFILVCL